MKEIQLQDALLEIGTEELPASYIPPALSFCNSFAEKFLKGQNLSFEKIYTLGTPRRLALLILGLHPSTSGQEKIISGPSLAQAKDAQGQWSQAALGFARSQGVNPEGLEVRITPKGQHLCVIKKELGKKTQSVLNNLYQELLPAIPFPKKMVWNQTLFPFARPIRNCVAIFGNKVLPFTVAGIKSTNKSFGLSHLHPKSITITAPKNYEMILRNQCVLVDANARRKAILNSANSLAGKIKGRIKEEESLLIEIIHLVEHPVCILGSFDPVYLDLPQEVLITCMKKHQKFISILDPNGKLMPHFISIRNGISEHQEIVRKGYEMVLGARLEDARFFFNEDLKKPLNSFIQKSSAISLQDKLGTLGDKITRMRGLSASLAKAYADSGGGAVDASVIDRAAELTKFDLTTNMVFEMPELQGVMGEIYAAKNGEKPLVACCIREHYYPLTNLSALPTSPEACIVALADKMDGLTGQFAIGYTPTGTQDPYGLRRHSTGILRILLKLKWDLPLQEIIEFGIAQFRLPETNGQLPAKIRGFLMDRFQRLMEEQSYTLDEIYSVTKNDLDADTRVLKIVSLQEKIKAVHNSRNHPDFDAVAAAFKRTTNILKQARSKNIAFSANSLQIDQLLLPEEQEMHKIITSIQEETLSLLQQKSYLLILQKWVRLRSSLDHFFEKVMVMDSNPEICRNRLSLLSNLEQLFKQIADFSLIQSKN